MKKSLSILLLYPLFSTAQSASPHFDNDTLYTSGGYKIYKGMTLQLASGTSDAGYFRFLRFHYSMARNDTYTLQNSSILVSKMKSFKNSGGNDQSIRFAGTAILKDGKKTEVDIIMEFEKAIEGTQGLPAELTIPEEFRTKPAEAISTEPKKQTVPAVTKKQAPGEEIKKQPAPDEIRKLLVADEIKKLFDLYKTGALTKEEYETQKKKLLDRQ